MKVIENEDVSPFDVDDTLIMTTTGVSAADSLVEVPDPLEPSRLIKFKVNESMVRLLREQHHRGSYVIVWSRGGYEWASAVVTALGLSNSVDLIMSKPKTYFDDLPVEKWLTDRVYLEPRSNYKQGV